MAVASAAHTVNAAANPAEHTVSYGGAVALALTSVTGVNSIAWSIVGQSNDSPSAPTITPAGVPLGATASFTQVADPGDGLGRSWRVRCKVVGSDGVAVYQYSIVGTTNDNDLLPIPAGESEGERHATLGWVKALNSALAHQTFDILLGAGEDQSLANGASANHDVLLTEGREYTFAIQLKGFDGTDRVYRYAEAHYSRITGGAAVLNYSDDEVNLFPVGNTDWSLTITTSSNSARFTVTNNSGAAGTYSLYVGSTNDPELSTP